MSKAPRTSRRAPIRGSLTADPELAALSYEQAVEQLESIIDRIESGEVGLEQSLAEYERGIGLLARCREILTRAEQRITELNPRAPGAGSRPGGSPADEDRPALDPHEEAPF